MADANANLIIPVYLNQRLVFDLIAMLQDGISTVTRVSSSDDVKSADKQRYGASFGLANALSSLLKIDVSGERTKGSEAATQTRLDTERVHTPSSLFQKLRGILSEKGALTKVTAEYKPVPGDMVEFSTALKRNPLIQTMDTLVKLMELATAFADGPQKNQSKKDQQKEAVKIKAQIETFMEGLKAGETIDVVSDSSEWKYKAVITLEQEYLNDPTMSDLVDGQFKVVGKVTRVIPDSNQSVSLLRKTSLSVLPSQTLKAIFDQISQAAASGDFQLPKIECEIPGPVIQLIPIAIFA